MEGSVIDGRELIMEAERYVGKEESMIIVDSLSKRSSAAMPKIGQFVSMKCAWRPIWQQVANTLDPWAPISP